MQYQPLHQLVADYDKNFGIILNTNHQLHQPPEVAPDEDPGNSGKLANQALKRIKK